MRSRLLLACQIFLLSSITSSGPTPSPTDNHQATQETNQNVNEIVEDWMTMYQQPTAEANCNPTMEAMCADQHQATVDEAWKYALQGSSFQTAALNNVPLEYQDTVEVNQALAWLDQEQAMVAVDAPSNMAMDASAVNTRSAPPATESESSCWCSGPDGARTLCNLCGDETLTAFLNSISERAVAEEKSAELKRLESSHELSPTSYVDVSVNAHSDLSKNGIVASSSTMPSSPHESSLKQPQLEGLPDVSFIWDSSDNQNHAEGSENRNGVLPSGAKCRKRKRIVPPATGKCDRCSKVVLRKWSRGPNGASNHCNSCGHLYWRYKKQQAASGKLAVDPTTGNLEAAKPPTKCRGCHKVGHTKWTCPQEFQGASGKLAVDQTTGNLEAAKPPNLEGEGAWKYKCGRCQIVGHNTRSCPDNPLIQLRKARISHLRKCPECGNRGHYSKTCPLKRSLKANLPKDA